MAFHTYKSSIIFLSVLICLTLMSSSYAETDKSTMSRNLVNLDKILELNKHPHKPYSFVVMGDSRSNPHRFKRIANLANSLEPDFIIHLGDIAIHGLNSEFDEVMPIFDSINAPLIAVIGNHDLTKEKPIRANFIKYFGKCDLTFDIQNVRFILEDNSLGYLKKSQNERIKADLDSNKIRMMFMHVPPMGPYPKHAFEGGSVEFIRNIKHTGCEYAFFAHIHGYDYRMIGERCHSYITGGAGAELNGHGFAQEIDHVLYVTVDGSSINVKMIPLNKK